MGGAIQVLQSLAVGLPVLLLHLCVAMCLWAISTIIYFRVTPLNKLRMIEEGNVAAAIGCGSVCIGLGMPLAFCLAGSVDVWDIVIWSLPILLLQIMIFFGISGLIRDLPGKVERGNIAVAVFIAAVRITSAMLLSAAIMD